MRLGLLMIEYKLSSWSLHITFWNLRRRALWEILGYLYNVCGSASLTKDLWTVKGREELSFDRLYHAGAALDSFMDFLYLFLFIEKSLDVLGYLLLKWSELVVHDLLNEVSDPSFKADSLLLVILLLFLMLVRVHLAHLLFIELFLFLGLMICCILWRYELFLVLESIVWLKLLAARLHHVSLLLLLHLHFWIIWLALVDKWFP